MSLGGLMLRKRLRNIRRNTQSVERRISFPVPPNDNIATIVCYGPSLRDTWGDIDTNTVVVSASKGHDFLRERGLWPQIHVEFDPRQHKVKHINDPYTGTLFCLASCVHPDVVSNLRHRNVFLWHAQQSPEEDLAIKEAEPDAVLIRGGSTVGLRAISLMYELGCRKFEIHGMDSSFADGGKTQWAGPHFGKSRHKRDTFSINVAGRRFYTSVCFAMYAQQFLACRATLKDATFNLHGDGLLQTLARQNTQERAA